MGLYLCLISDLSWVVFKQAAFILHSGNVVLILFGLINFFDMFNHFFAFGFQDSASPIMEAIVDLHNNIMFYLIAIVIFVFLCFI